MTIENKTIYTDNSTTTPVRREVVEEMIHYLTENLGNPYSICQNEIEQNEIEQNKIKVRLSVKTILEKQLIIEEIKKLKAKRKTVRRP